MGEGAVQVIRIGAVEKHPNADSLSMTTVLGGYPVIFKTGDYKPGDLAVYVPVDSIVPATEEWAWLGDSPKHRRIKAKRLRKIFSMGVLTAAPEDTKEGDEVGDRLGITRWDDEEPEATKPRSLIVADFSAIEKFLAWALPKLPAWLVPRSLFGKYIKATSNSNAPKGLKRLPGVYNIEPYRRFGRHTFKDGEVVVATEKIHGQNASFVSVKGKLHCKSKTVWRSTEFGTSTWANVANKYGLADKLAEVPGIILFGETYGNNSDMPYGVKDREHLGDDFIAFDAFDTKTGRWFDFYEFIKLCVDLDIPYAPVLSTITWGPDSYDYLLPLCEGQTTLPGARGQHIREGFVVRSVNERQVGPRAVLKMVSESYLTRKEVAA